MIHLYCGDGKGKTTAAVGLTVRAAGSGKKVLFAQFLKGRPSGELKVLESLECVTVVRGSQKEKFTFQMNSEERAAAAAAEARLLDSLEAMISREDPAMVVLDEVVTAVERGMLSEEQVRSLVSSFPKEKELVLTGARPESWMVEAADYVTDMEKIRHPFDRGIPAREGVEY